MKIEHIELFKVDRPLESPFRIAVATRDKYEGVFVKIVTDDGLVGWGESAPSYRLTRETTASVIEELTRVKPSLIGKDPCDITHILTNLDLSPAALTGVETALWDITAQSLGTPLYRVFGSTRNEFDTSITIGIKSLDEVARHAEKLVNEGVSIIKLKIGVNPEEDIERVKLVRSIAANARIRVDGNLGYTVDEAIRVARGIEKYDIEFFEEPVAGLGNLKKLRKSIGIKVMADESVKTLNEAITAIREKAVDYVNLKLQKMGGITRTRIICDVLADAGILCMIGGFSETLIAMTVAAHLKVAHPNIEFADLDAHIGIVDPPVAGGFTLKGSHAILPGTAGLGARGSP